MTLGALCRDVGFKALFTEISIVPIYKTLLSDRIPTGGAAETLFMKVGSLVLHSFYSYNKKYQSLTKMCFG